jgi:putative endonuclease
MWHVYILECKNGRLYTGITNNLKKRCEAHLAGKGGKFTRAFKAKKLLFSEEAQDRGAALRREARIKSWTRREKLAFIKRALKAVTGPIKCQDFP